MSPRLGPRIILHCDLDAFYPSCEIKRNPSLAGKPLIVGADPKAGHGRGVVMSCSYEARKFADKFEQTSIDEVYLDVGDRCASFDEAIDLARKLKIELKNVEGLTVSVGVAPNKSIAKMASDMNKPDGLTAVRPDDVKAFLEPLSVNKISGVGKKTTEFLQER